MLGTNPKDFNSFRGFKYYLGQQMDVGGAGGTYGGEKCVQGFGGEY
jgi:hypothetical protein